MANRVTVVDKGANALIQRVKGLKEPLYLKVGIQGREAEAGHSKGQLTVFEVALFHEFGLGVPERSFIRGWYDENEGSIREDLNRVSRGVLLGTFSLEKGLEILGLKFQAQIQERIAANIPPPLAASTIAKKGSSVALIDTGQLRSAITYALSKSLA